MLVISRKLMEKVCIGPDITIQVVSINRGKIRLAIEAPREIEVDRQEIREQKERERAKQTTNTLETI
jgi:carbon storage regulator